MAQAQNTSIDAVSGLQPLSYLNQNQPATVLFVRQSRPPTPNDKNYKFSTIWLDTASDEVFILINVQNNAAIWVLLGGLGAFPITPFVVGPIGNAGFQTIQAGLDAANQAGGGLVYVQPDTYNENLTLYDKVHLASLIDVEGSAVTIIGTHTPPSGGDLSIRGFNLSGTSAIISTTNDGSTNISFEECFFAVTDGWVCNLINWTGKITIQQCTNNSTNDGVFNNTGGSLFVSKNSELGQGITRAFTVTGGVRLDSTILECFINISGGNNVFDYSTLGRKVTLTGTATLFALFCTFIGGSLAALSTTSSNPITLMNCNIDASGSPAIEGTGAVELSNVTFDQDIALSANLTLPGISKVTATAFQTVIESQNTGILIENTNIQAQGLNATIDLNMIPKSGGNVKINPGALVLDSVGGGIQIKEGANARMGIATLVGGSALVLNNMVSNNTRIFLSHQTISAGPASIGALSVDTVSAGFNFLIRSSVGGDAGVVAWMLVEPA